MSPFSYECEYAICDTPGHKTEEAFRGANGSVCDLNGSNTQIPPPSLPSVQTISSDDGKLKSGG